MKNAESLYEISPAGVNAEAGHLFNVEINPEHRLFDGHFPGQPVLPGVIILKIIVACASELTGKKLFLKEVKQAKYMQFIDPGLHPEFQVRLSINNTEENTQVNATVFFHEIIFTKASLQLN